MAINKIIGHDVLLSYPNFSERMKIHTYTSKLHLGIVVRGKWGFHFLCIAQVNPNFINYTTTVRKLFSIVETLKENSVPLY